MKHDEFVCPTDLDERCAVPVFDVVSLRSPGGVLVFRVVRVAHAESDPGGTRVEALIGYQHTPLTNQVHLQVRQLFNDVLCGKHNHIKSRFFDHLLLIIGPQKGRGEVQIVFVLPPVVWVYTKLVQKFGLGKLESLKCRTVIGLDYDQDQSQSLLH